MRHERTRDDEVGIGVKAHGQLIGVVIEIALDGVAPAVKGILALLGVAAETRIELRRAAIGQMGDFPREAEAEGGAVALRRVVVVSSPPFWIALNGLELEMREGHLLGRGSRPRDEHRDGPHPFRERRRPLHRPIPSEARAGDQRPAFDPEQVGQLRLRRAHVADCRLGESGPPGPSVGRQVGRAGGSLASAQNVGAHHEVPVSVDGEAGADDVLPPPRLPVAARRVRIPRQSVAQKDGVGGVLVQLPPRFVGHAHVRQPPAELQLEGADVGKLPLARVVPLAPRSGDRNRQTRARIIAGVEVPDGLGVGDVVERRVPDQKIRQVDWHLLASVRGCAPALGP